MSERAGPWMRLQGGRRFYPLDPRAEDVHMEDIAHALSLICRFGGHCPRHYSVAEHSILVSLLVERTNPELALAGLLHDAAEAYIGDMVRPLKRGTEWGQSFSRVETGILEAIGEKFGVQLVIRLSHWELGDSELAQAISGADDLALAYEAKHLLRIDPAAEGWERLPEPPVLTDEEWHWMPSKHLLGARSQGHAEWHFVDRFANLTTAVTA